MLLITDKSREVLRRPPRWPYRVNWDDPQAQGLFMALPLFNQPRFGELTCFGTASTQVNEVSTNRQLGKWGIQPHVGRVYEPTGGGTDGLPSRERAVCEREQGCLVGIGDDDASVNGVQHSA